MSDHTFLKRFPHLQQEPRRSEMDGLVRNLPAHKSATAQDALKAQGNWLLFLPRYIPDLNPIEMAFSKLKTLIRTAAARTYDDLWRAVGRVCDLFRH